MATKYLDLAGLQTLLSKLFAREFKGLGLSKNDFTDALKTKLESIAAPEDLTELAAKVAQLEALVASDSDGVINKFNEIVTFLAGIGDDKTLNGVLSDISTQIAAAKKAGTDAQSALDAFKPTVYSKTEADGKFVAKETGKSLSSNDYTTAEKNAVATIGNKVDKVTGKGLSSNDYTSAEKALVATISDKLNASDVASISTEEITTLLSSVGI